MPFAALIIGAIILVVAINNSYADLAHELESDIPGFFKWGIAIAAILALGYIPGLRTPSRWLLALVVVVLLVTQGQAILAGLSSFAASSGQASGTPPPGPTAAYAAAATAGSASGGTAATSAAGGANSVAAAAGTIGKLATSVGSIAANPLNPMAYVGSFESIASSLGGLL
jgi:hypothetical protein